MSYYERPREKASLYGLENLSNAELLAILISTGTRNKSSLDIANELLVMGIKKSNPHFDDYICLVERTREELKDLLRKEATVSIKRYVGLI